MLVAVGSPEIDVMGATHGNGQQNGLENFFWKLAHLQVTWGRSRCKTRRQYDVDHFSQLVPGDFHEGKATDPNRVMRDYLDRGRSKRTGRYSCRAAATRSKTS